MWFTRLAQFDPLKERPSMRKLVPWYGLALGIVAGLSLAQAQTPAAPEIPLTIEQHKFTPEEIKVKAGQPFVLVITNKDATPEEFESKELRVEKVVPGNKTLKVRMGALKPGTYKFFGEYHEDTAKGRIVAE
jgi:plastocyanin